MLLKAVRLSMFSVILLIDFTEANNKTKSNNSFLDKFHQSDFEIVFERLEMVRHSKSFFKKFEVITFKYNRTTAAANLTWIANTNIETFDVVIQAYRFASNEYRTFPIRLQLSACSAIKNNIAGAGTITQCGNFAGCPLKKNIVVRICNWFPDQTHFPPLIPSGKYMFETQGVFRTTELYLLHAYATIVYPIV